MNSYKQKFAADCFRTISKEKANLIDLFFNRNLRCIKTYRKANYYYEKSRKILALFWKFKLRLKTTKYAFNISASTSIGKGMTIPHNGPVTINSKAIIGDNCDIGIGVTIGEENRGKRKGCPTIGNRVWIGTNAVIVGHIKIGNNVLIAPNSFVNFDVPDNSIVIGNPGKIIHKSNATEDYIVRIVN
jgi:serine O-acetyltransferase